VVENLALDDTVAPPAQSVLEAPFEPISGITKDVESQGKPVLARSDTSAKSYEVQHATLSSNSHFLPSSSSRVD